MTACSAPRLLRCALTWLLRPMRDLHSRPHSGQGKSGPVGCASLWRLSRLSFNHFIRSSSKSAKPALESARHSCRSTAWVSSSLGSMWQAFRVLLALSLYLFSWPPAVLRPSVNSPYRSCLGSRESSIRTTCPSHLRRLRLSMLSRDTQPVLSRTTVCGTLSFQVMPRIFRRKTCGIAQGFLSDFGKVSRFRCRIVVPILRLRDTPLFWSLI